MKSDIEQEISLEKVDLILTFVQLLRNLDTKNMPNSQKKLAWALGVLTLLAGIVFVFVLSMPEEKPLPQTQTPLTGPIRYNCELSGGSFKNGNCVCSIEEGQTQESMYDKETGFCQSTIGGPAGDAFNASIGLPYGEYDYWRQIVMDLCTNSGGNISGAACICPAGKNYSKTNGKCE